MERNTYFQGVKVIEFANVLAGPAVGMFFAELGAEVIKIENKNGGDLTRHWKTINENQNSKTSSYFHSVNWNKKSLFLDLLDESDHAVALQHISEAAIILVNFKAGDAKKFNLESDYLHKKFSHLIIGEIIGYPNSDRVAFDAVLQAETGFMSMNGNVDSDPLKMPIAFIDLLAAHQLKEGILIGLLQKNKTGKGSIVTVSLYESAIASLANQASNYLNNHQVPKLSGSLHPNIAPYGEVMVTKDNEQIILAIGTDHQFYCLCKVLDMEGLTNDMKYKSNLQRVKNRISLYEELKKVFCNFSADKLLAQFNIHKIPAGKINNLQQVFEDDNAKKMILQQMEEDQTISKRISTIAFNIE